jgi:hypothetical protein
VDSNVWENFDDGQFVKAKCYDGGVVLFMQEEWGIIDHLLLHCEVARDLWSSIYNLFGVVWVIPRRVINLLNSWRSQVGYRPVREAWQLAPLCLWWCLWPERNARNFEDVEMLGTKLRKFVLYTFYT